MCWKDKSSGKGNQQTKDGGRLSTTCAYILKKTRIEEFQGLIFVFRTLEIFSSVVASLKVWMCMFDFI